ncbi:thioredoxin domain-containing protein [soil metagenome]
MNRVPILSYSRRLWPWLATSALLLAGCSAPYNSDLKKTSGNTEGSDPSASTVISYKLSPYLSAHQDDLVNWSPWGQASFDLAKAQNKPILLSIGFSACHWCHVMQKESFNDAATAKYMNDHFINVLVDREDRPDVDAYYTRQLEALSGRAGWPMTLFLRADGKAFYAGTYFPPGDENAPHSFRKVLGQINDMWLSDQRAIDAACAKVSDSLSSPKNASLAQLLNYANLNFALGRLLQRCDQEFGGLKQSRKFPVAAVNTLIMRLTVNKEMNNSYSDLLPFCRRYLATTLNGMANGQINDQLSGGFFRYATNKEWLRPHFEKMLADNALIAQNFFEAYNITRNRFWLNKGVMTVEFILAELALPNGMFAGSLSADSLSQNSDERLSQQAEGAYYTFSAQDLDKALPKAIRAAADQAFNFTAQGNCGDGKNLPYFKSTNTTKPLAAAKQPAISEGLRKLEDWRMKRPKPSRNDTAIASWNGMAISTLITAFQSTGNPKYLEAAERAATAVLSKMFLAERLAHSDSSTQEGFLDDYAYLERALLDLSTVSKNSQWLRKAQELNDIVLERFLEKESGKFLYSPRGSDSELGVKVGSKIYATTDSTWPGSAGVAIENLIRLAAVPNTSGPKSNVPNQVASKPSPIDSSDVNYLDIARRSLSASGRAMQEDPVAHASMLVALERLLSKN